MFTKSDLKTGDFLVQRDGTVELVILETGTLITKDGYYNRLSQFDFDLCYHSNKDYDIVKVYRPVYVNDYEVNGRCFTCYSKGRLMFNREEIKEVTMSEIEKKFGCKVKIIKE